MGGTARCLPRRRLGRRSACSVLRRHPPAEDQSRCRHVHPVSDELDATALVVQNMALVEIVAHRGPAARDAGPGCNGPTRCDRTHDGKC